MIERKVGEVAGAPSKRLRADLVYSVPATSNYESAYLFKTTGPYNLGGPRGMILRHRHHLPASALFRDVDTGSNTQPRILLEPREELLEVCRWNAKVAVELHDKVEAFLFCKLESGVERSNNWRAGPSCYASRQADE